MSRPTSRIPTRSPAPLRRTTCSKAARFGFLSAAIADAIKDCSRRGGLVLDPFCGSGTILIAAERTGRKARALEIDPAYVDVAVRRWQSYSGKVAVLAGSSETFETIEERRIARPAAA